ncbi:adenosylcobalamin-dependent ribonucleoside-diphosphate reductase [Thioalkalivibrio thiocyanodenitrificans]|uniref:adenosylcobalamin-dependent ribonucleoside-diphosphate reductase n=1 Tax=Thioalkalivibrio thiocyanodenitrificans TaxID=243063 RepID=UPI0003A50FCA|nr:adenosylcobalamin-dependent ribonucleoside-diphosphate reductase [Thioalkalivibrio thiocyanodenitrificans]
MNAVIEEEKSAVESEVPLQEASADTWRRKYRLTDRANNPVDECVQDTFKRVARVLADVEAPEVREHWYERFVYAMKKGAFPAGRVLANAGAQAYKPATSTINCTVSGTVFDSMSSILDRVHEAGMTLKAGCGIGYEFSTLRPKGAFVGGAGATTSGPMSFMDIYDSMCKTVSSAGGRRGAQMGTFDVQHPDVLDFIRAKRENGRLRQFNLSLLINDAFVEAVKSDSDWPLVFPLTQAEIDHEGIDLNDESRVLWRDWTVTDGYVVHDETGFVACRIYRTIKARHLWDMVMNSTYDYADPGFILVDRVNEQNNNWFCEDIRATNPCGEQPLPPYGACLLGSINLVKFVKNPFTGNAFFDFTEFREVVRIFTRMLDNVVEINGLPLEKQRAEIMRKRRHGMGFLGLGSAMAMLGIKYGSDDSVILTDEVSKTMALEGYRAGLELAKEKGPAPIMEEEFEITPKMMRQRPELAKAGFEVGDMVKGKVLWARFSRYMQKLTTQDQQLIRDLSECGCRFTHHTSIAPTGTMALSVGNNVSNGIEPSFAHSYWRNIIRPGKKSKENVPVFSYELLAYRHMVNPEADVSPDAESGNVLPESFVTADSIAPLDHVKVQAAAQKWVDSSISKTANVPTDFPYEDFKDIYLFAYEQGLKGCTTFRFNPEAHQGVLVREDDLANTTYVFKLANGEMVEAKGNEMIEYDGETHTAANLYDALKEGYYGRH